MKKALVNTICQLMQKYSNVYLFTGDLGFGVMNPIIENFKDRFINVGICEQLLASCSAGMALEGNLVFMYSLGNFPTLRCMEQIRNDIAYHNANVKIVAVGGGFAYGQLGMSHHATEDIAMMRAIPNMTVLAPADSVETIESVKLAAKIDGPVYIRLGRGGERSINHKSIDISKPMELDISRGERKGKKLMLIGSGIVMPDVQDAAKELGNNYNVSVYSIAQLKPFDSDSIIKIIKDYEYILSIEEHNIIGGLGSLLSEIIAENNLKVKFKRIGLNDEFTQIVGSPSYLRKAYGLSKDGIIKTAENFVTPNEK